MSRQVICMCLVAVIAAGCSIPHRAKTSANLSLEDKISDKSKTDREKAGLIGPVRTVRVETAALENKAGKPVEGPPQLSETRRYRRDGATIEIASYGAEGSVVSRFACQYGSDGKSTGYARYRAGALFEKTTLKRDAKGRIREQINYRRDGAPVEKIVPEYDRRGNIIRSEHYEPDGSLALTIKLRYDPEGREVEQASYSPDGKLTSRGTIERNSSGDPICIHQYDGQGKLESRTVITCSPEERRIEERRYHGSGAPSDSYVRKYDANWTCIEAISYSSNGRPSEKKLYDGKSNVLEETKYKPDGSIEFRHAYTYGFDARGNWTKQTKSKWIMKDGKPGFQPIQVKYRTLTYYR